MRLPSRHYHFPTRCLDEYWTNSNRFPENAEDWLERSGLGFCASSTIPPAALSKGKEYQNQAWDLHRAGGKFSSDLSECGLAKGSPMDNDKEQAMDSGTPELF